MADTPHIMVVEARFYDDIADALMEGALAALDEAGASYERFAVLGAFEAPAAIAIAIRSMEFFTARQRFDGYVALGCVIRGETSHYDYICDAAIGGLAAIGRETGRPVTCGVVTAETFEQALQRAGGKHGNKGFDAAMALLECHSLTERIAR